MSASSLADLALARDAEEPGKQLKSAAATLVTMIPTEVLVAYTALTGTVHGVLDHPTSYVPFRMAAYVTFVVLAGLIPLVLFRHAASGGRQRREYPVLECATAMIAAAAWGAAMPDGALSFRLKDDALTLATTAVILGCTLMLSIMARYAGTANELNPTNSLSAGTPSTSPGPGAGTHLTSVSSVSPMNPTPVANPAPAASPAAA